MGPGISLNTSLEELEKLNGNTRQAIKMYWGNADAVSESDGTAVFKAEYYRHWPRNYFVTTASRPDMSM